MKEEKVELSKSERANNMDHREEKISISQQEPTARSDRGSGNTDSSRSRRRNSEIIQARKQHS